ncbi:hypothetical protein PF001_g22400 [Phytophthora fragariae]|uniref:Uncharacterized protein n=1 Tax=Phytophthora fragariae TaxID=53985 RepID=A0A6A4C667_9STRA|nr:hypothetical protein PF001_g22400 [Phytophthora fragariae]
MEAEGIEKAVFSLQLACIPLHITTSMGALLDSYGTDAATQAAEGVENMVAACWAIGAALYLQAVWRWRVEHFDPLNNVSEAHHEACLRFAIRTGHATVTSSSLSALPREKGVEVGRTLRFMLGETWEWDATIMAPTGVRHLVLGRRMGNIN